MWAARDSRSPTPYAYATAHFEGTDALAEGVFELANPSEAFRNVQILVLSGHVRDGFNAAFAPGVPRRAPDAQHQLSICE